MLIASYFDDYFIKVWEMKDIYFYIYKKGNIKFIIFAILNN